MQAFYFCLKKCKIIVCEVKLNFTDDRWQKARDFSHGMNAT